MFIDTLCPRGHKVFNELTLSAIKKIESKLMVVATRRCVNDTIDYEIPDKYFFEAAKDFIKIKSKIYFRVLEMKKWVWLLKLIRKIKPNLIIISSYETITFAIFSRFIRAPIMVFNHNNIDEICVSKIKRVFFRCIAHNVTHVVFEEYMRDYLKNVIKIKNNIIVLPHIVKENKLDEEMYRETDKLVLFAPSSSNDSSVINDLRNKEEMLSEKSIFIIAKSSFCLDGRNIILKDYFNNEEYDQYMKTCTAVYAPLPNTFNYRISNVINEGIAYGKPIITSNTKYTKFLKENYSSLVYILNTNIFDERENIAKWLSEIKEVFWKDRMRFLKDHHEKRFMDIFSDYIKFIY